MANLAKYSVALEAETSKYRAELEKANRQLSKFNRDQKKALDAVATGFKVLAAAAVAAVFTGFIRESINAADAANKLSQKIGVSTETLTGIDLALRLSGASTQQFGVAMLRLSRAASDANQGLATAVRTFGNLGIAVADSSGNLRSTDDLLFDIADKFSQYEDGAQKAALAQELFGRSGANLIPLLNQGSAGIKEQIEQARRLGLVWTKEAASGAERFNDSLTVLAAVGRGAGTQLAQSLLPSLNTLTAYLIESTKEGETAAGMINALAASFKVLATGVIVSLELLSGFGDSLGALGAAVTFALKRDFKAAGNVFREFADNTEDRISKLTKTVEGLWATAGDAAKSAADEQIRSFAELINAGAAAAEAEKQQVKNAQAAQTLVEALKKQAETLGMTTAQVKLFELAQLGATEAQRQSAQASLEAIEIFEELQNRKRLAEEDLMASIGREDARQAEFRSLVDGLRTEEEAIRESYQRRLQIIVENTQAGSEQQAELIRRLGESTEKQLENIKATTDEMTRFGDQAARNIQDAFADFLFDPFDEGLKGMLNGFLTTLRRMAAEAASSAILSSLFSGMSGNANPLLAALGASFGGARAKGGPVSGGKSYLVGERGPEIFVPRSSGQIATGMGGGTNIQVIDQRGAGAPPVDISSQMQGGVEQIRIMIRSEVGGMFADGAIDRQFRAASMPIRRVGNR